MSADIEILRRNYEELQQQFDILKKEALKAIEPFGQYPIQSGLHPATPVFTSIIKGKDIDAGHFYAAQSFIARWGR